MYCSASLMDASDNVVSIYLGWHQCGYRRPPANVGRWAVDDPGRRTTGSGRHELVIGVPTALTGVGGV